MVSFLLDCTNTDITSGHVQQVYFIFPKLPVDLFLLVPQLSAVNEQ